MGSGMTRWCTTALGALAAAALAGCTFYTDGINGEPDAFIFKATAGPHYLGQPIELSAITSSDPNDDGRDLTARWLVQVCNDALGADCPEQFDTEELSIFDNYVLRTDERRTYRVTLDVRDARGASDRAVLVIEVDNRVPELDPDVQGCDTCGGYVLGTWVDILADASDPDGDEVALDWTLFAPDASVDADRSFTPVTGYPSPAYRLMPDVVGLYTVSITATDTGGGETSVDRSFQIVPDAPPCLAQIEPPVPGATYVVYTDDEPRRFAALAVNDDLDPFPAPLDPGPFRGETEFRWYIASPDTGGVFTEVAGQGAADYLLDPSSFAVGDEIALRVEVDDRIGRTISCDADDDTCSIGGDGCLQRVTWGVSIR